jgi:uncharacterized protein YdiU (UPF0061 family)
LAFSLLDILMKNNMDYTRSFRALSHVSKTDKVVLLRDDCLDRDTFDAWFKRYNERLQRESISDSSTSTTNASHQS